MTYYKQTDGDHIIAIGTGYGGEEISEEEYNDILAAIRSHPSAEGKGYRLRTDMTWEEYDEQPIVVSDDDELSEDEVLDILLGGAL